MIITMWLLSFSFYYDIVWLAVVANLVFTFMLYFGGTGPCFVWTNEVAEPFVVGLSLMAGWLISITVSKLFPYLYQYLPLYWTPMTQTIAGTVLFVLYRPFFIETKDKSTQAIRDEFARFKYNIFRTD